MKLFGALLGGCAASALAILPTHALTPSQMAVLFSEGSTYVGPGDVYPGAVGYWGPGGYSRAAVSRGTQKSVNVRRASDSATQDIFVLPNGALNIAAATAFAGTDAVCQGSTSGSSTTIAFTGCTSTPLAGDTVDGSGIAKPAYLTACSAFVAGAGTCTLNVAQNIAIAETVTMAVAMLLPVIYDQTGNGNHCVQATAGSQLQLLPNGGPNGESSVLGSSGKSMTCGTGASMDVAGAGYSIILWANLVTDPADTKQYDWFAKTIQNLSGGGYGFDYNRSGANRRVDLYKSGVANQFLTITALSVGTWYNLVASQAFSAAPTSVTYYSNNASLGSVSNASVYQSSATRTAYLFGGPTFSASVSPAAIMGYLAVYPSTLSAGNVTSLYNNGYH